MTDHAARAREIIEKGYLEGWVTDRHLHWGRKTLEAVFCAVEAEALEKAAQMIKVCSERPGVTAEYYIAAIRAMKP